MLLTIHIIVTFFVGHQRPFSMPFTHSSTCPDLCMWYATAITSQVSTTNLCLARLLGGISTQTRTSSFAHVFAGGYSAAYYAYIWSEVLDADTVAWFEEHGGLTRENGDRFRRFVLGRGNAEDPIAAYRAFRGRDADIAPLLRRRGLE